jgi:LDH2 family malate/lactate/ureidoglycolate dehydrogenase
MRVNADELQKFGAALLIAYGVEAAQAQSVAANLTWCELVGRINFGFQRLPVHLKRLKLGVLKGDCKPQFNKIAESAERLDGDSGFGHYIGELAMKRAVDLAQKTGIGLVGVKNSNFFGAGAYFANMAAQAGMIGLAMSNSFPKVVAHGGLKPVLGTNPFAFGAPRRNGEHLLIDMATSALAGSTVREHIEKNKPLPSRFAVDGAGLPITDATKVADGALLPFGGPKGFALGLMVEMLAGVLTSASVGSGVASMYNDFSRSGDNGHFILALDIKRWMDLEEYYARFEALIAAIKASGTEVLLPGEIRWKNYRQALRSGIALQADTISKVSDYAKGVGLTTLWVASSTA